MQILQIFHKANGCGKILPQTGVREATAKSFSGFTERENHFPDFPTTFCFGSLRFTVHYEFNSILLKSTLDKSLSLECSQPFPVNTNWSKQFA